MTSDIKITISGSCSMTKYELAKIVGENLKLRGFGSVKVIGEDYASDCRKGILRGESIEIHVEPKEIDKNHILYDLMQKNRITINEEIV